MITVLYWIYCLAFAFDFRGETGGSAVQYVFLLVALASGGLIVVSGKRSLFVVPGVYLVFLWGIYLISTPLVAFSQNVPFGNYVRCSLPLFLLGLSLLVMQVMAATRLTPKQLLNPIILSGCISVVWRAFYALGVKRIPISEIRYELLSAAAPLFIGYVMVCFFFSARKFPWDAIVAGGLVFGTLFVSITRSYIATAGFAFLACIALLYGSLRLRQWTTAAIHAKLRQAGMLVIVGMGLILAVIATNPMVLERWIGRLFENAGTGADTSLDVTMLTRLAEADSMNKILADHPHRYAFGVGLGANYFWDEAYSQELLLVYGTREMLNEEHFFPGHSTWVYALFSGGYFGLLVMTLLIFGGLAFAWRTNRKLSQAGVPPDEFRLLPLVVILCYFSQTFTANPFGERYAGLLLGLFLAFPQVFLNRHRMAVQERRQQQTMMVPVMERSDQTWVADSNTPRLQS